MQGGPEDLPPQLQIIFVRLMEVLLMTLGGIWQAVRQDFNLLEIGLVIAGAWAWKRGRFPRIPWQWIPRKPWTAALAIALGTVALRLALIPLQRVPVPIVTDEFSHLLLADTLLHGRVANPTHPFWPHFESLHIIQKPHYVSSYFPGQAAMLAAGRAIFGHPWAGVLAECAGFLAALYWSLRGWMPARWALFGVILAALRLGIASYWIDAYHGGFLPAIGGALIFGALGWQRKSPRLGQALAIGIGLAILALTRPFEGLLFSIPIVVLAAWNFRRSIAALALIAVPGVAGAAADAMYAKQITGSPFVTAYQISQKAYGFPGTLAWTRFRGLHNSNVEIQRYYELEVSQQEHFSSPLNYLEYFTMTFQEYWRFFLGPVLTVPLLMLGRVWRRRRLMVLTIAGGLVAILLEGAGSPHYFAPATAVAIAIVVECCRYFPAPVLLPAAMALVLTLRIGAQAADLPYTQALNFQSWCCRVEGNLDKARIAGSLEKIPGRHLVFVRTKSDPNNLFQWIYNDADIDASRIVWARDLGGEENARLAAYFHDRDTWMVDPNVEPAACGHYFPSSGGMQAQSGGPK